MVNGMAFVVQEVKHPEFTVSEKEGKKLHEREVREFPLLLVSIGSGVSMIKVNDFDSYSRVNGTMIGGGTLLGLGNILTGENNFDRIVELAQKGDNRNVDMLVRDIYGDFVPIEGLDGDLLASSLAKVTFDNEFDKDMQFTHKPAQSYRKEDILNSLVFMISFNIGQLAVLT
eukprot:CAMPEP_0202973616 /NCGR_PEP_ID=MMETSP1396-20130829/51894_1 /ASSEMBLY_ACC=CAM_ASM_000872 /TAXON_ID= /ORGANISM="Pseudokeronopsis sp., Strain Brazil" /LENGTH=171 /DNA_ID=CAMNT_0049705971 /DNA_START=324 /DNA_END=839 /DNA_ORIENTATION=+